MHFGVGKGIAVFIGNLQMVTKGKGDACLSCCWLHAGILDNRPIYISSSHSLPWTHFEGLFQKALAFLFKELRKNELRTAEDLVLRALCLTFQIDCGHASDTGTSQAPVMHPSVKLGLVRRDLDQGRNWLSFLLSRQQEKHSSLWDAPKLSWFQCCFLKSLASENDDSLPTPGVSLPSNRQ